MFDERSSISEPTRVDDTRYQPKRRLGDDPIHGLAGKTLSDFWAWAYSDIMENTQRATYAEFMVATALGIADEVRIGWRSYDLKYGMRRIEVKASAYVQSWHTTKPSKIIFGVGKRLEMDDVTAAYGKIPARFADVWVFALFQPKSHPAGDVIDTDLWQFFVVSGQALEERIGDAKTASLATIQAFGEPARYSELKGAIDQVITMNPRQAQ